MKRILIVGGFIENTTKKKKKSELIDKNLNEQIEFAKLLGKEVIKQGHILLNACMTHFDQVVCEGADEACKELNYISDQKIISYVLSGKKPVHDFGDIKKSQLLNWDLGGPALASPEPIRFADVVIFVGGYEGTYKAANWARIKNKPLLPVPKFKGESEKIYYSELNEFDEKYSTRIKQEEYEDLNQINASLSKLASKVISLSEIISTPNYAFAIMSFKESPELLDIFNSFEDVCNEFKYKCVRMDKELETRNILAEMIHKIKDCAFALIDITQPSHNVYFELGFAHGQSKEFIICAKKGTELPFDITNLQIIFWESQTELKDALRRRIKRIAENQGRI